MYLKSYYPYEMNFTEPRKLVGDRIDPGFTIRLPKKLYTRAQRVAGKRNVVQLTDEQLAFLRTNRIFRELERKGEKGGYVIMDKVPGYQQTPEERIADLEAENERLKAQKEPQKPLEKMAYKDLSALAKEKGINPVGMSRAKLVEALKGN